jgi:hypothetical protein
LSDLATTKTPEINTTILDSFLSDIRAQPTWRPESDRAADYYDGNQITPQMRATLEGRGQPVLIHNLIAPSIDGVLGLEAKTRADWKLVADDDSGLPVVDALDQELNEAARIAQADKACADAYAAQVKTGLGWVEINRESDPFKYPYTISYVHRNEIWWDWHSKRSDLEDCRWLMRKKWIDCDTLSHHFPEHKTIIDNVSSGWAGWDNWGELQTLTGSADLMGAYSVESNFSMARGDWFNSDRKLALTFEVYYRVWDKKPVMKLPSGDVILYDAKNQMHQAAVASEQVQVIVANFSRMRLAYFIGPHKVADIDSPHPHDKFPYVPFFGYREDKTGIPYGLIRRMMPAQDEINHRRSKLTWLLNIKRVVKDSDALFGMSDQQMMDELSRADGVVNLNKDRKNANAFKIETETGIAAQQFQVLAESQKLIQDVAGVYSAFLGQESGAKSGVAIDSLVEQGTVTLAELNDNYRFARQLVGELLLANIVSDIGNQEKQVRINVNSPKKSKTIVLNERMAVEGGKERINNSVLRTKTRVVLSDITQTPGYRQQMNLMLMDMVSKLPPEYQAAMIEMVIETSDLSNREEVLAQIRKISGSIDEQELSPEEQQAMIAQKEEQEQQKALQFKAMAAEVEGKIAEAKKKVAETAALEANIGIDNATKVEQLNKLKAETKQIIANVVKIRQETVRVIDQDIKQLAPPEPKQVA